LITKEFGNPLYILLIYLKNTENILSKLATFSKKVRELENPDVDEYFYKQKNSTSGLLIRV